VFPVGAYHFPWMCSSSDASRYNEHLKFTFNPTWQNIKLLLNSSAIHFDIGRSIN